MASGDEVEVDMRSPARPPRLRREVRTGVFTATRCNRHITACRDLEAGNVQNSVPCQEHSVLVTNEPQTEYATFIKGGGRPR